MKYNRFQINTKNIPKELRKYILTKIKDKLEENGYDVSGEDSYIFAPDVGCIILGYQPNGKIDSHLKGVWNGHNNVKYPSYDAIADWDNWTKIKAVKDFEPITLELDPMTRVAVNKTHVNINGSVINFEKFDKIAEAVQKARNFDKEF